MGSRVVLQGLMLSIGIVHIVAGVGLSFSQRFQGLLAALYGAELWNPDLQTVYFTRVLGSFAVVIGALTVWSSRDPVGRSVGVVCLVELFLVRNVHRHLYSDELTSGFGVSGAVNLGTTVLLAMVSVALVALLWMAQRQAGDPPPRN